MAYRQDLMKTVYRSLGDGEIERGKKILLRMMDSFGSEMAAEIISEDTGIELCRQNLNYWKRIATNKGNKAKTDRETNVKVKVPDTPSITSPNIPTTHEMDCETILFFTDLHAPYQHPDAIRFLRKVKEAWLPTIVINGGDECDKHAMSFHTSDPNLDAAGSELCKARKVLRELADVFPEMFICESNHGSMAYRKAMVAGIPVEYIKDYIDVLFPNGNQPKWYWDEEWVMKSEEYGDTVFKHQFTGRCATAACHEGMNIAAGHLHSKFELEWTQSNGRRYFGLRGGCLVDTKALAYKYATVFKDKPFLGCVVIHKGVPVLIPMTLDKKTKRWTGELV